MCFVGVVVRCRFGCVHLRTSTCRLEMRHPVTCARVCAVGACEVTHHPPLSHTPTCNDVQGWRPRGPGCCHFIYPVCPDDCLTGSSLSSRAVSCLCRVSRCAAGPCVATQHQLLHRNVFLFVCVVMILPQVHLRKPCYDFTFL